MSVHVGENVNEGKEEGGDGRKENESVAASV